LLLSYLQAFHNATVLQVFADDFVDIGFIDVGVPDAVGVHHEHRAIIATVEATCLVDADIAFALETERRNAALGIGLHSSCAAVIAGDFAFAALIAAEEDVVLEILAHGVIEVGLLLSL
jgi:hypothetical protein